MEKEVIFFWTPKAAGTSIYNVLKKYGCRSLFEVEKFKNFDNKGSVTFSHVDINYLLDHGYMSNSYFNRCFKFGVVRNPWSRLVSLYTYLNYDETLTFEEFVLMLEARYNLQQSKAYDFYQHFPFFRQVVSRGTHKRSIHFLRYLLPLPKVGPYNVLELSQANPQVAWLTNSEGELIVDKVCKFENINDDFMEVCKILGIDEELPWHNKTNHNHYKKYYNENLIDVVSRIYKKDIEMFGYEF
jgi:hypothetical protein